MTGERVVVIGAGIGGLAAAARLASAGVEVTVVEAADGPGGKLREAEVDGVRLDAGPTVLTLREVLEEVFADAGASLSDHLRLRPARVLARHAWDSERHLDLYADPAETEAAIGAFCGAAEARRFRHFAQRASALYDTLGPSFVHATRPTVLGLVRRVARHRPAALADLAPFTTLWRELGREFGDPRLRQLFARYATYAGSSPFLSPATLMVIAAVEQRGVWLVEGGMHRIAAALAALAAKRGAVLRYGARAREIVVSRGRIAGVWLDGGDVVGADAVVFNGDAAALAAGLLGPATARAVAPIPPAARSLSALTLCVLARVRGFPLARHSVFFCRDYEAEFTDLFERRRLPAEPTVYVCAQDRDDAGLARLAPGRERLLCIINAPATGDAAPPGAAEVERCVNRALARLQRCGVDLARESAEMLRTTPADFAHRYPGTGGALYGRASHGWQASFSRPGPRTRIPGLYVAGGSTHPGAGVPMAAISGRLAASAVLQDFASTRMSSRAATAGGTSTRSATTGSRH
ncbi:MAG: phytoene desaturase [Proteobacteria bacterium]|nr:phytoene desaturase [Pseudomonadota bacterium]